MSLKNVLAIAAFAGYTCALLMPAYARVDACGESGSCIVGDITVSRDVTTWNLEVRDFTGDGNCAYALIRIDRNNLPDHEDRSPNVCGEGKKMPWNGRLQYSGTRGARVIACMDRNNLPDQCSVIHYQREQ